MFLLILMFLFSVEAESDVRCRPVTGLDEDDSTYRLRTPDGISPEERARVAAAAQKALDFTGFVNCDFELQTVQSPWMTLDVFEVVHGSCLTLTVHYIAVDASGRTYLLTGHPREGPEREGETTVDDALETYAALCELEGLWIDDREDAEEYLEFVLRAFDPWAGIPLSGRAAADEIARIERFSSESRRRMEALGRVQEFWLEGLIEGKVGWTAEAFFWEAGWGGLERVSLGTSRRGRIFFEKTAYAEQPKPPHVEE